MNNKDYNGYTITKKWNTDNLGVGYILQCNDGDKFGLIYGHLDHNRQGKKATWIYFFRKSLNLIYKKFTPVTYLKYYSSEDPFKELFEVAYVTPLKNYALVDFENKTNDKREQVCIEGKYIYSDIWKEMTCGNLLIDASYTSASIYYPVINDKDKSITYYDYHAYSEKNNPSCILTCFSGLNKLKIFLSKYNYEGIVLRIEEIRNYIDSFYLDKELNSFIAGVEGCFQNYPGRDDSFFITHYWKYTGNDAYLNQIVPLHREMNYYNCCGRPEEDYDKIDLEETQKLRLIIKKKYIKENHFLFLINDFLSNLKEHKRLYSIYNDDICSFISEKDKGIFDKIYTEKEYKNLLFTYNKG